DGTGGLHGPRRPGRPGTGRRAGGLQAQRRLEHGARGRGDRLRPLPVHGGAPHRAARGRARRGMGAPSRGPGPARLVDDRPGARLPGAALVVHHQPGPPLEHPGDHRPGHAPGAVGPLPLAQAPQLRRRGGRGHRPAPGARRLDHGARLLRGQRLPAAGPHPHRGRRPGGAPRARRGAPCV
ncbi:MAG: FIG01130075: hypothetical protein, partial [uncultured Nocardioides sp.]